MDRNVDTTIRGRCRACLEKDVDVVALSLTVSVFAEEVTLSQMLNTCCAIEISASDLKPQTLCNHCAKTAQHFFTFRKTCQNADVTLQEELDRINIKVESDELIVKEELDEDDHKNAIMADIKDEFGDNVLLSNTDDLTQLQSNQNTSSTEEIVCKTCQMNFTDWISLEHHMENCYRDVYGVCRQAFTNADALHDHTQTHEIPSMDKTVILKREKSKRYKCRFCKMSYKYPAELRNHAMTHTAVKHYLCLYCKNKFNLSHPSKCERTQSHHSRKDVYKKMDRRNSSKTQPHFGCLICKKSYRRQEPLMHHKCNHTSKKLHKCSQCSKEFLCVSKLLRHARIHSGEKPYECPHCSKRFTDRSHLTPHIRTHTGEKPYECSHCSMRFRTRRALTVHKRTHTGEKSYECSHCSMRFSTQHLLTVHKRTHTGEKSYECSHCNKCFSSGSNLTVHKRIHTGEKPYECSHCSKRFNTQRELTLHIRTHTGEKPHECSHCSKRFTNRSNLYQHIRTHTGEKPYECSHCGKRFTQLSSLKTHKNNHIG